jgi:hypothetical protein
VVGELAGVKRISTYLRLLAIVAAFGALGVLRPLVDRLEEWVEDQDRLPY